MFTGADSSEGVLGGEKDRKDWLLVGRVDVFFRGLLARGCWLDETETERPAVSKSRKLSLGDGGARFIGRSNV